MKRLLSGLLLAAPFLAFFTPAVSASEGAGWCHLTPWLQDLAPAFDRAGYSVELHGAWAFVQSLGAQQVQVYRRSGPSFTPTQVLTGPALETFLYGDVLLYHGGELFVSAPNTHAGQPGAEAVYVYGLEGSTWTLRQTLTAKTPVSAGSFGRTLAADGDWLAVGAPGNSDHVGVFRRVGGSWQHTTDLGSPLGKMGRAPAVKAGSDGSYAHVLAGSNTADAPGKTSAGLLVPFRVNDQGGFHGAPLQPDALAAFDEFGSSLVFDGERLVVGAPRDKVAGHSVGAAWVFACQQGVFFPEFELLEVLRPQAEAVVAQFGADLSLAALPDGATRLAVGTQYGATGEVAKGGAVYTFRAGPGQAQFHFEARLTRAGGQHGDLLGFSVAAHGELVLAGAPNAHALEGEAVLFSLLPANYPGGLAPADYLATAQTFGPAGGGAMDFHLAASKPPVPGESITLVLSGAQPGALAWLGWSLAPGEWQLFGTTLLLANPELMFLGLLGAQGLAHLPLAIPSDPALAGAHLLLQGFTAAPVQNQWQVNASNGLALWIGF